MLAAKLQPVLETKADDLPRANNELSIESDHKSNTSDEIDFFDNYDGRYFENSIGDLGATHGLGKFRKFTNPDDRRGPELSEEYKAKLDAKLLSKRIENTPPSEERADDDPDISISFERK